MTKLEFDGLSRDVKAFYSTASGKKFIDEVLKHCGYGQVVYSNDGFVDVNGTLVSAAKFEINALISSFIKE